MLIESREILVHFVRVIKRGNRLSRCKNRALNNGRVSASVSLSRKIERKKKKSIDQFHPRDLTIPTNVGSRTWTNILVKEAKSFPALRIKAPPLPRDDAYSNETGMPGFAHRVI